MEIVKNCDHIDEESINENDSSQVDTMLYDMASVGYLSTINSNGEPEPPRVKVFVNGGEGDIPICTYGMMKRMESRFTHVYV